ncbi:hypothetical protein [Lentzea xinjiangensis]|uniref:hypothetical protein n=1 Tax=Lentzea xinjiangensis TaxID=402600 RepID=UPI000B7D6583|nr:hypothetical protein [Lentzea xinjiangensis]
MIGLLVVVAITACATSDEGLGDRRVPVGGPPAAQSWALDDDTVTDAEYRKAVDDFVLCVRAAGYAVTDPALSPVDGLSLIYRITPAGDPAAYNDIVQTCNIGTMSHIEPRYVEPRHQRMDNRLRPVVAGCLRDRGIATSGQEENVVDFDARTENDDLLMECVLHAVNEVFPELPDVITIRK